MAGGRPVFVSLKPVRMLVGTWVGRGSKDARMLDARKWKRGKEVKEAGRGVLSPRKARVERCLGGGGSNP